MHFLGNRRCHDIKDKYGSKISKTRKACIWFRDKNSISSLIPDDISNYLDAMVNSSLPFPSTAQEGVLSTIYIILRQFYVSLIHF